MGGRGRFWEGRMWMFKRGGGLVGEGIYSGRVGVDSGSIACSCRKGGGGRGRAGKGGRRAKGATNDLNNCDVYLL